MKAVIEIPKGDNRRRHLKADKSGFIDMGPTKDVIPVNSGIMPVHYGYIPETVNEKERDEIDVLVLSDDASKVGQEIEVKPIALILREDEDDKVVAVDKTREQLKKWSDIPEPERALIEEFFSYHHKFRSIENAEFAIEYINKGCELFLQTQK